MATTDLGMSGLASGFDWKSFVDQMISVERSPETTLRTNQSKINQKNSAFGNLKTLIATLQTKTQALKDSTLYDGRAASSSDTSVATASAVSGAAAGTYVFKINQLATSSQIKGGTNIGKALSATDDVSALTLSSAGFPSAVTAGTFTVNGKQVTIATTDSLQQVFDKIGTATGNTVTGSYDSASDTIKLSSSGEIVLGSATDTSNFLQVARLSNNGTGAISSSLPLGSIRLSASLASANFATTVTDGGSGAGEFKINGVSINYNASTDTVASVINRINASTAGVTASYDTVNDRFVLVSKATGDMGIAMQDVTGNFLAASGLAAGALTRGQNLTYTINGGDILTSQSNTITDASSGITGLSVTALKNNSTSVVTVSNDTSTIKSAINDFITAYNRVQSTIDSYTASSTDASGNVTSGVLAGDRDAEDISNSIRKLAYSSISGLTGTIKHLADLGISTNGNDSTITLDGADKLDSALANNLSGVKDFFSNATNGLGVTLDGYFTRTIGDSGTLVAHQNSLTTQSTSIDDQIARMERVIAADKDRMTASFVAMETAQAGINQQLSYLSKIGS